MHFATVAASAALVGSAMAGNYYQPSVAYYTTKGAVYTSTCTTAKAKPTPAPVYYTTPKAAPAPVYYTTPKAAPAPAPVYTSAAPYYSSPAPAPVYHTPYEVTYTSYAAVTVGPKVYSSAVYSVSTCTGGYYTPSPAPVYHSPSPAPYYSSPAPAPYYQPPANTSCTGTPYAAPTPAPYGHPTPAPAPAYTPTWSTSTYCPSSAPYVHPTPAPYSAPVPAPPPSYTSPAPAPYNATTPTYSPPPTYTGAASVNTLSFGVAAVAALVALIAA